MTGSAGSRLPVGGNDNCGCATVICGTREQRRDLVARSGQIPRLHQSSFLPSISSRPFLPLSPAGSLFFLFISSYRSTQAIERGRRLFCWSRPSISLFSFPFLPAPATRHSFALLTLTMRHRIPHLLLSLAFAWSLLVGLAAAAPAPLNSSTETLYRRQENGSSITQPVVTQTVQTINTFVLSLSLMDPPCVLADSLSRVVVVLLVLPGLLLRRALSR
jgi:hypothetical protein